MSIISFFTFLYIYIPILIFLWGWTKAWIALVCTIVITYSLYRLYQDLSNDAKKYICIDIRVLCVVVVFFLCVGYVAGWGAFTQQKGDWMKHNIILQDLVEKEWPVYYKNKNEYSMLTYYIGAYIFPAFIGKIVQSLRVAEICMYVWAQIGVILVFLNMVNVLKLKSKIIQLVAAFMTCFFSTPLYLAQLVNDLVYGEDTIFTQMWFSWDLLLQYSDNFTLLQWVMPQVIVLWLTVLMLIEYKKRVEYYVLIALPAMLYSVLTFLGLIPLMLATTVEYMLSEKSIKMASRRVFGKSNILMTCTVGITLLLYYYGNVLGVKPSSIGFYLVDYSDGNIWKYFIFVGVMVVPYIFFLWKKESIFLSSIASLMLLPLFHMGLYNDLVMRCSVAALFVLCLSSISYVNTFVERHYYKDFRRGWKFIGFSTLLFIGFCVPLDYFNSSATYAIIEAQGKENIWDRFAPSGWYLDGIYDEKSNQWMFTGVNITSLEIYANRYDDTIPVDVKYNYYSYDIRENIFYKYIARVQME